MSEKDASQYKIGAVANLTGLPVETIRTWERRYELITPHRTESGMRLYSREDVRRLQMIKELSSQGEAVSSLSKLSGEQLHARLYQHAANSVDIKVAPIRASSALSLGLIGEHLSEQAAMLEREFGNQWNIDWKYERISSVKELQPVAALAFEINALDGVSVQDLISAVKASPTTVILGHYDYLPRNELRALEAAGVYLVKGPLRSSALLRTLNDYCELNELRAKNRSLSVLPVSHEGITPPKSEGLDLEYSRAQLAMLGEVRTSVACECPSQLAGLISGMIAFEEYSYGCESKNAEDSELHRFLAQETGRARKMLEQALRILCEAESIEIAPE